MAERIAETRMEEMVKNRWTYEGEEILEDTNMVSVTGEIAEKLQVHHELMDEKFFRTTIKVTRMSGNVDMIPIHISERLISAKLQKTLTGKRVKISGQMRSYNRMGDDGKHHLNIVLFVKNFELLSDEESNYVQDENIVELEGYVCRDTCYRITPMGRQITDILLAVNRSYQKSDYIPCIVWGRNALYAREFNIGDKIKIQGRVQSREYFKRYSNKLPEGEFRMAYEISVQRIVKL